MLQGRLFSYPDTHRYRIGPNYQQLPINAPKVPVHSYNRDGAMRYANMPDPVYAPNSMNGPAALSDLYADDTYEVTGEIMRSAYRPHRGGRRLRPASGAVGERAQRRGPHEPRPTTSSGTRRRRR